VKRKKKNIVALEEQGVWDFSLSIYGEPEVEQACLLMQDKLDVDINLLLTCLWMAVSGRGRLSLEELDDLEAQVAFWRDEIIIPLRQVRKRLKDVSRIGGQIHKSLKKAVSSCELDAEQVEQQMLEQALLHRHQDVESGAARRLGDALQNILLLMQRSSQMEPGWNRSLAILLGACFPGLERAEVVGILNSQSA